MSFETDASGESITVFEIEITATCTLGFGESSVTLSSETERVTSDEAAPDAGTPFKMTVSVNDPIEVDASGAFQAGNLSGTITDSDAEGDYELTFTATLLEEFSCSGGPVTWTASSV